MVNNPDIGKLVLRLMLGLLMLLHGISTVSYTHLTLPTKA